VLAFLVLVERCGELVVDGMVFFDLVASAVSGLISRAPADGKDFAYARYSGAHETLADGSRPTNRAADRAKLQWLRGSWPELFSIPRAFRRSFESLEMRTVVA